MSPYCLYCTVCKHNFNSLLEWNAHLPEINHQRRAKLQCRKWTAVNKECVIVVFGSCPVVDCGLVTLLSSVIGGGFVTDFIYWKKKPNIGLLQFESSDSVDKVLRKTGPEIWIDVNNRVQLRKAVDYFDLEWNFLFSLSAASNLELYSGNDDDATQITTAVKKEKVAKKRKAKNLTANENPEINTKKKKRKKSNSEVDPAAASSSKHTTARKECRTNEDGTTISKKTKKVKASKSKEENALAPRKQKKPKENVEAVNCTETAENNSDDSPKPEDQQKEVKLDLMSKSEVAAPPQSCTEAACYATPAVRQSICEETFTALDNETPPDADLATSEVEESSEPELAEECEALDPGHTDQFISPVSEINCEIQSVISMSLDIEDNSCRPINVDQSDTNSTDTEVVILSSDESDEENNIMGEENLEDDREQQHHIPNNDNYDDDVEEENNILESFRKEYISLLQDILIPSEKYENAFNLIAMLESEFKKTVPECRVIPFRHWHLGIKSAGTNDLLLFLDHSGIWGKEEWNEATYDPIKPFIISKFFRSPELIFSDIQKISEPGQSGKNCINPNVENFGIEYLHVPTGLKFRVINSPLLLHEVQTCRLIQYLCEFDPIVLPLLGLLNYWANVNSLMFGNFRVTNRSNPFDSPSPASLNWLVLLFLMKKKVIPSARKILSEPHKRIICRGKDLGFSDDPSYPKTWSGLTMKPLQLPEQIARLRNTDDIELYSLPRIVRMLQIVRDFFSFYRTNIRQIGFNQGIIFNSKDGNIQTKAEIMNRNKKLELDNSERNFLNHAERFTKHDVCILHPIDFSKFSLSFNDEIFKLVLFPLMELTMKKIRKFLSSLRKGKMPETSLSQLFKVNRDDIKKKGKNKSSRSRNGKKVKSKPNGKNKAKSKNVKKVKPKPNGKNKVKSKNKKKS